MVDNFDFDFFKLWHGIPEEDIDRVVPSVDNTLKRWVGELKSDYSMRLLGTSENGHEYISEEERFVNFHILGAPGEGKSKFLEYHIRRDVDLGNGLCLLDPSDKGDTARNVLNYCAAKKHEKVILIDPETITKYKKIPCIAPLRQKSVKRSVAGMMEALNILFDSKSTATPRIRRYLTALFRLLARQNLMLKDARYFTDYYANKEKREQILGNDTDSQTIRGVFRTPYSFENYFSSSINRLDALWQEPLASILSNTDGINFRRAVGEGWVILVNLSPYLLTEDESQLLGIIVISQIIQAVDALASNNWNGIFYLYVDEAGRFATPQIETLLSYKRKSGIRLYLAHHHYDQFEDKRKVLSSIENNTGVKLMFNTRSFDDRMRMIKSLGYGGNIPHALAVYANSDLPKQHTVLKKNKESPVRIKIPDVEDAPRAPKEYLEKLLSQPFYKDKQDYVRSAPKNTESAQSRKMDDRQPVDQTDVPRGIQSRRDQKAGLRPGQQKPPDAPPEKPIKI